MRRSGEREPEPGLALAWGLEAANAARVVIIAQLYPVLGDLREPQR